MRKVQNYSSVLFPGKLLLLGYVAVAIAFSSCDPAKRVAKDQYLLVRNNVKYSINQSGRGLEREITSVTKQQLAYLTVPENIDAEAVQAYIKQKPNTKLLGLFPLHLFIYNLVNPEKAQEKKVERDNKIDEKNRKKIAEGKKAKSDDQIRAMKERRTFREWLMNAGEPPVIFDSTLMSASLTQIELFLKSKGYFKCKVRDSVALRNKKARVFYIIKRGEPYRIDSLKYTCGDSAMLAKIYSDSSNCLIKQGDIYDQDAFLKERDHLTHYLSDNGYYAFSKLYVNYEIDSTIGKHRMNITINVSMFAKQYKPNPDSTLEVPHPIFHIRKVIIQMQYNPSNINYIAGDTELVGDYMFVYPKGEIGFKPVTLLKKIFIRKGDLYHISNVDYTYTGLAQLKTFRYINVKFNSVGDSMLDCYIQLMPSVKQSIGLELVGQNTGGDLGIQGDVVYENKNLFDGGEIFQFKIKGGLEAEGGEAVNNGGGLNNIVQLNTIDIGPEMDFTIPRPFFPFNLGATVDSTHILRRSLGLWPKANPQTVFKILYDYQSLPSEYERNIFGLAYTFNYDPYEKKDQKKWHIELKFPEVNYVHATLFPQFQDELKSTNNFFLINSFDNHLIPDLGITVVFNNQTLAKLHHFDFLKISLEESGAIIRTADNLIYNTPDSTYKIEGVPYSHYIKGELDYRHYWVLSKEDKIVGRLYAGAGVPLEGGGEELPFDKSFWGGGANDLRGWDPRTLGPGGYSEPNIVDQIGDIKLEANLEYRFNLIKFIDLAVFTDAGNIWLLNPNKAEPNGNFLWSGPNAFYNQIAVDFGVGIRLDFNYFVLRFDFGEPIRNPALALGHEWTDKEISLYHTVINFGIGYPF